MDFTLKTYQRLLQALQGAGYVFITFAEYCKGDRPPKYVVLRHDIDLLPTRAWHFAQLQAQLGIRGAYYFRAVPESWDEMIIKNIADLGHEVGYHYENLSTHKGDATKAIADFKAHLYALRQLALVDTICMHGSPRSTYDSKDLWKDYNYRDYGIIGEPYFDMDFEHCLYLTDTGRRWDGWKVSVRDKVVQQEQWQKEGFVFHSTQDIIKAINNGILPDHIMMTFHPQRWHSKPFPWFKELVFQNLKNIVKWFLVK